jgi:hypothetical protein
MDRLVLETGLRQPRALALYQQFGYAPIPAYRTNGDFELSVHLGKKLDS